MGVTHYQVLGVPEDASYSVIRASYMSSALALHPDKLSLSDNPPLPAHFLKLQEAWTVLRDSGSRSAYDRQLNSSRISTDIVAEDVLLEEMGRESCEEAGTFEYFFPCRCGDFFAVSSGELEALGFNDCCRGSGRHCDDEKNLGSCKKGDTFGEIWSASKVVNEDFQHIRSEIDEVPEGHSGDLRQGSHAKQPSSLELKSITLSCGSCSLKIRLHF